LWVRGIDLRCFCFPDNADRALAGDTTVAGGDRELVWSFGLGVGKSSVRHGGLGLRMWCGSIFVGIALGIACNNEIGKSTVRDGELELRRMWRGSIFVGIALGISCSNEIRKSTVRERER
jgi:hypothetical protein